jgi:surface polysaccharide O-acyltransferase-like enzyme
MLFAPFINNYIIGKKPIFEDFVYIFLLFALFMTLNQISSIGREIFNAYMGWFKLFPWYIGYFIMGHFIDVYHSKIPISNKITILLLIGILAISCTLNYYSASALGVVKDYFILSNTGILNFTVTVLIYYFFSTNRNKFSQSYLITNVASASFGIYLIHPVFLALLRKNVTYYFNEPIIGLPLLIIMTFFLSYLTISMLTKIKWFKAVC